MSAKKLHGFLDDHVYVCFETLESDSDTQIFPQAAASHSVLLLSGMVSFKFKAMATSALSTKISEIWNIVER